MIAAPCPVLTPLTVTARGGKCPRGDVARGDGRMGIRTGRLAAPTGPSRLRDQFHYIRGSGTVGGGGAGRGGCSIFFDK